MPLELSRDDRRILLITAAVFVVLLVGSLLLVSPAGNRSEVPTTYSTASQGAKAAYLLLQESGYRVERWENSPSSLPTGQDKTLILAEPAAFPNETERSALHNFVRSGGRLIATGAFVGMMLPENAATVDPMESMEWESYAALRPSAITRTAPTITLAAQAHWVQSSSAVALYGDDDRVVVVRYSYGAGEVIWWASATPLTNAGLREPRNLEFFLACLGGKRSTQVLWDEYFHGYGHAAEGMRTNPVVEGLLAQLIVLAMAILLTFSRRSGPVRPGAADVRLSPLEFVETLGGLYEHARASAVAVDISYQRFQYWLFKRLGIANNTSIEDVEIAVRDRWNFCDAKFASTLRGAAAARYHPELPPKQALQLVQELHSYAEQLKLFPAPVKEKR